MSQINPFTKNNLNKQGFEYLNDEEKSHFELPLRFSPGVGTILIVIGLFLQSYVWIGSMAIVALSGALLPKGMLLDLVYNLGVRHLFHAPPLPPTPKPRQFSYLLSTLYLTGSALFFYFKLPVWGTILGGLVAIAGTVLTTSLWCLGSWYYRLLFRHE